MDPQTPSFELGAWATLQGYGYSAPPSKETPYILPGYSFYPASSVPYLLGTPQAPAEDALFAWRLQDALWREPMQNDGRLHASSPVVVQEHPIGYPFTSSSLKVLPASSSYRLDTPETTIEEAYDDRLSRLDRSIRPLVEKYSGTHQLTVLAFVERYWAQNGSMPLRVVPKPKPVEWSKKKLRINAAPESVICEVVNCKRSFTTVQKASDHLLADHTYEVTGNHKGLFECPDW
ncbi:hypothetical protein FRC17_005852 [Serendipita sp. 399]|nr:hypothetical protein FRC17_005852 [Serendipita sp. 399]